MPTIPQLTALDQQERTRTFSTVEQLTVMGLPLLAKVTFTAALAALPTQDTDNEAR
jgi:hypothetical protein